VIPLWLLVVVGLGGIVLGVSTTLVGVALLTGGRAQSRIVIDFERDRNGWRWRCDAPELPCPRPLATIVAARLGAAQALLTYQEAEALLRRKAERP
jgi:hypothetical protein